METQELAAMQAEKNRVAQNSVAAAVAITGCKFVIGVLTGSLGIISEAMHSGIDLVAAIITMLSVRVSDKPADADHQFGHGKFENFSAFLEMTLLLGTCVWIVWAAVKRLLHGGVEIEPSAWAFVVMLMSIAVDWWRSRRLRRVAEKFDSQALEADALHFATDIWSSAVVVLGLGCVMVGRMLHIAWLELADPVAALGVACIIFSVSLRMARQTIDALLDAAPEGARTEIMRELAQQEGVVAVERVRIRRAGARCFVDLRLAQDRTMSFQAASAVAERAAECVRRILGDADVTVNAVPCVGRRETIFDRVRASALRNSLAVHDISVQDVEGRLHVEMDVELGESMTLLAAHDRVTALESDILAHVPEIDTILSHIENEPSTIEATEEADDHPAIEDSLRRIAKTFPEIVDVHELSLKRIAERLHLSAHVTMRDELTLGRVHEIQTDLEIRLLNEHPQIYRVLLHPEPQTDNQR